jgi:2-keto-4-pentenoate hydratase
MDQASIGKAADLLVAARKTGKLLERLPEGMRPASVAEAALVQDAVMARLNETPGGWKIAPYAGGGWNYGVMIKSMMWENGTAIDSKLLTMLGLEAEIAFRFDRDLPPRATDYSTDEVAAAMTLVIGMEICDTRFTNMNDPEPLERTADFMVNAGFVSGTLRPDWRDLDLAEVEASLIVNGEVTVKQKGDGPKKKPLERAVAMVNILRHTTGVKAGNVVTCGSYTGMAFAKPGDKIGGSFAGLGAVELSFTAK